MKVTKSLSLILAFAVCVPMLYSCVLTDSIPLSSPDDFTEETEETERSVFSSSAENTEYDPDEINLYVIEADAKSADVTEELPVIVGPKEEDFIALEQEANSPERERADEKARLAVEKAEEEARLSAAKEEEAKLEAVKAEEARLASEKAEEEARLAAETAKDAEQDEMLALLSVNLPLDTAIEAVRVALTNADAVDVFTADGNYYDPERFHGSTYSGEFAFSVEDQGSWQADSRWAWSVKDMILLKKQYDRALKVSCKVTCDGQNYIVYNVSYIGGPSELVRSGEALTIYGATVMEPSQGNPLTLPVSLVNVMTDGISQFDTLYVPENQDATRQEPVWEPEPEPVWAPEPENTLQPENTWTPEPEQVWTPDPENALQPENTWTPEAEPVWTPDPENTWQPENTWTPEPEPAWTPEPEDTWQSENTWTPEPVVISIEPTEPDNYGYGEQGTRNHPSEDLLWDWYAGISRYDEYGREIFFVNMETGKIHQQTCRYCNWGKYDWPVKATVFPDELIMSQSDFYSYCQVCCKGW